MCLKKIIIIIITNLILSMWSYASRMNYDMDRQSITDSVRFYYNKGIDFGKIGKLDSALIYTQKSVELLKNSPSLDTTALANPYQSLGIINKLLGRYNEAIECYNKSEKIYLSQNKTSLLAYVYGNKANIYFIQQDYSKAEDFQNRAYNIFKQDSLRFKTQISLAYSNLGNIYRKRKDNLKAIQYYKKSLQVSNSENLNFVALSNLALSYESLKNYEKAKSYYIKAIGIAEKSFGINNIKTATRYLDYANFLSKQGSKDQAIKYFYLASNIYKDNFGTKHPSLSNGYNDLGEHFLRNNQLDSALFYFQKSLIALSPDYDDTDIKSNPSITNVLSKTHLLKSLKNKANVLSRMALVNQNIDYYKLSILTYDLTIETINKIRSGYISEESKLFLADNEFETFSDALQTCYELYNLTNDKSYIEKLFNYSESGKSAILTEALKTSNALNIGGIPDSLIVKERQLEKSIWSYEELIYEENKKKSPDENKLGYWNKYLFEKKQAYDELSKYLENNFQKYHTLKHTQHSVKISDIQSKLDNNNILIEYFFTNNKIYTFLIGKDFSHIYKQNITDTFHQNLDSLLLALSNNNFSSHGYKDFKQYQKSSYYIYSKLIEPYKKQIENKNLIIIPDGKLAYLPFEVLTTNNKPFQRINYKELPYLLYKHQFNYYYSALFLFDNQASKQIADKKLGAFAPTYNNIDSLPADRLAFRQEYREKLFPLKGIKTEVQEISDLLNGDEYVDEEANESTFKRVAPEYDILHLAMHTIMDDKNPMYSKMAFTQQDDSTEDGFLNTYELYNMKLNSRMAVLSSCNSGSGKLYRGEGVMSLARGFIYAGCPSIIMTLWSVEDKSGVKLMTSFYKNLLKGKTKSEAIQLSKIEFIKNADQLKSHPYFWSGYVVIGDNSALFKSNTKILITVSLLVVILILLGVVFRKNIKNLF